MWNANGIYPGWQIGLVPKLTDPREPAPDPRVVGRGPLPENVGRMKAVRLVGESVVMEYSAGDALIQEWVTQSKDENGSAVDRCLRIGPTKQALVLVLGVQLKGEISVESMEGEESVQMKSIGEISYVQVPPHASMIGFRVQYSGRPGVHTKALPFPSGMNKSRWPQEVVTRAKLSQKKAAYVVDDIALPYDNPWKRNVRPSDIQFLSDGTGVTVTLDGDVWLLRGLRDSLSEIRWKRFTSGLHEPMTLAIRDDEIYVFDKNGIWRLRDTNGDDEADVHELFSNAFAQTLNTREFPATIRNAPNGEFVIAKGGMQKSFGKQNGSVLRISADGRKATVLGYGFRQPTIGVNVRTGLVTAGDQQENYIPGTPLHVVRDAQFYGYIDDGLHGRGKYPAPIADPLTWIPHAVNASAISQVWLFDAKMGALNDGFVHIGFSRPELFKIMLNDRGAKLQAAVTSITTDFLYPPLNGSVNPADGQLYIAGFQIIGFGNGVSVPAGMGRVRYTGAEVTLPEEVVPMDKGVLIRFGVELDPKQATNPDNYSLASWHYKRTPSYGSAQYNAADKPGVDWHAPSSAYLSKDGRSVFVGVPDMKPVMQLHVGWALATAKGREFQKNAYTTPYSLAAFDPQAEGFGNIQVDLTPRALAKKKERRVSIEEGRRLYGMLGCIACHSVNGDSISTIGPTWMGLFGSRREVLINGKHSKTTADTAYLRESILDPAAKIVRGFEQGEYAMPSYAGVVTDSQIESLILYIQGVKDGDTATITFASSAVTARADTLWFREGFREASPEIPVHQKHLADQDLILRRLGPGESQIKLSYHENIPGDPHYVWSGVCPGPWALSFQHRTIAIDLSQGKVRWHTKQSGNRKLHVILKTPDGWLVSDQSTPKSLAWIISEIEFASCRWFRFDTERITKGKEVKHSDLTSIREIGFTDLMPGGNSGACSRLDWIEVHEGSRQHSQQARQSNDRE